VGASYIFMRIAGPVLGPIALMAFRVIIAGGLLLVIAKSLGQTPDFRARWRQFLLIGAIGNAIPFVLIGNATIHLNASIAGILWAVLFLHEPVTPGLFAGLGVILLSVWLVLGEKRAAGGGGRA
jgi:drug/metabolite transporter (DMT)-like permease